MSKEEITIVVPEAASGNLVDLTAFLSKKLDLHGGYGLGGENGYGVEYENDTFMMHPFCWCEQDDCKWCAKNAPNFHYKPTDAKIWWYKWIGRSEEMKGKLPKDWLDICKKSVQS
jgi:hypothetical protein